MWVVPVLNNKKGFSLVELLFSVTFISISMLAVVMSIMTAMRTNVENDIRSTAVRLTNQTAETLFALQWARVGSVLQLDPELTVTLPGSPHRRTGGDAFQDAKGFPKLNQTIRNYQFNYQIEWTVEDLTPNSKRIVISVSYTKSNGVLLTNTAVVYRQINI